MRSLRCLYLIKQSSRHSTRTIRNGTVISTSKTRPSASRSYRTNLKTTFFAPFSTQIRDSTIYALSTAPGRAAIAIIRCSGDSCLQIYQRLCPGSPPIKPRRATVRTLYRQTENTSPEVIDSEALVLYFPGPNTATGEDVLEFHVHGGPAVVKAVLAAIPETGAHGPGTRSVIRYAEPGEFTRRAFYNNRLDLTQIEALGDTLSAETEQQRRLAVRGMSNTLNDRYDQWRHLLLQARGELEALIDFSEDQHFDESAEDFVRSISHQIHTLVTQIHKTTRNAAKGELLRHGFKIALLGAPNAGKSSLLNQIVGREAAIVSSEAGTTRDIIEVNVDIGGFFCRFNDLAGVRSQIQGDSTIGAIEQEGIRRAKTYAQKADVVVVIVPVEIQATGPHPAFNPEILKFVKDKLSDSQRILVVLNKSDLAGADVEPVVEEANKYLQENLNRSLVVTPVSCLLPAQDGAGKTSNVDGLQHFLTTLTDQLSLMTEAEQIELETPPAHSSDESLGTSMRQRTLLEQCATELEAFLKEIDISQSVDASTDAEDIDVVLSAERLRIAADCLAKITGKGESGDVEEVLGVVFEKFCVGK